MIEENTLYYWLALLYLRQTSPILLIKWLTTIGDIKSLFTASSDLLQKMGFKPAAITSIQQCNWDAVLQDYEWCQQNDCHIITLVDPRYPPQLKHIPDPPLVLFVQGEVAHLLKPQIAIVGSRNPTPYGKEAALQFAYYLVKQNFMITSGLALGIDAKSHEGALKANGITLAVFGTGLKHIYPAAHHVLAEKIRQQGALISEFLPDEKPRAFHFPRRNRLISGLSLGVLVVEAALRSGSLITARFALEQGREVFAIPGSIHNPLSRGCHALIREGAKLVECVDDILIELNAPFLPTHAIITPENPLTLDSRLQQLLADINDEVTPMDVITLRSGLTTSELSSMLLSLELQGYIEQLQGGYVKIRSKNIRGEYV